MDHSRSANGRSLTSGPALQPNNAFVARTLERCNFPAEGTEVDLAVSGGADSLALMVLAVAAGCMVTAHHVDHGLRPGSDREADLVAEVSELLGTKFRSWKVDVGEGPDLEARARKARFEVLPVGVFTGHTADDRAETILLNLMRGSGPTGAVGISRSPRRPLLDLRRKDTEALCDAVGLVPFEDPSNRDPRFRRNRVRHEVLPLLSNIADRDVVPILIRQADLFSEIDSAIASAASELDPTSAKALAQAPKAVAGTAVRLWLVSSGVGDGYTLDGASIERVLEVARGLHKATEVAGGWRVSRTQGRLRVSPPSSWQDGAHD